MMSFEASARDVRNLMKLGVLITCVQVDFNIVLKYHSSFYGLLPSYFCMPVDKIINHNVYSFILFIY